MTSEQCSQINSFMFRRTPDFDNDIKKDRFPTNTMYSNFYRQEVWKLGTGTTHTRDKIHVTRPNDTGCWSEIVLGGSGTATGCDSLCETPRKSIGWGSTRYNYVKYKTSYQTPPFCYDQLRHVEEVIQQLEGIVEGIKEMPDSIVSDFTRILSLRQSEVIYIAGEDNLTVDITADTFINDCRRIDLGSADNVPTSQLTMNYLDNHIEDLSYNGYHKKEFLPEGTFAITMDAQTHRNLTKQNPDLVQLLALSDFGRGGQYYEYGFMGKGIGSWVFKYDKEPLRFQHIGNGVLERIWPFQNVAATVGKRPEFDTAYKNAPIQLYHVYNRDARTFFVGDISPVNPEMKFNMSRDMLGKWSWKSPDYFKYQDPNTGLICEYGNDNHNKGYFLGEYELGAVTDYPNIEMMILALRQPQCVTDKPLCGPVPARVYQTTNPYNVFCNEGE